MKTQLNRTFIKQDQKLAERLMDLFQFVNNIRKTPDMALRGGIYREIFNADCFTLKWDGWEFGYKLEDHGLHFRRKVFVRCDQALSEVPDDEKDRILATVMGVFIEKGQSQPDIIQISLYTILLHQDVIPFLMVEKSPRLISKGPLIH